MVPPHWVFLDRRRFDQTPYVSRATHQKPYIGIQPNFYILIYTPYCIHSWKKMTLFLRFIVVKIERTAIFQFWALHSVLQCTHLFFAFSSKRQLFGIHAPIFMGFLPIGHVYKCPYIISNTKNSSFGGFFCDLGANFAISCILIYGTFVWSRRDTSAQWWGTITQCVVAATGSSFHHILALGLNFYGMNLICADI